MQVYYDVLSGFVTETKRDSFSFGDERASPESSGLSGEQADGPNQCHESSHTAAPQGVESPKHSQFSPLKSQLNIGTFHLSKIR